MKMVSIKKAAGVLLAVAMAPTAWAQTTCNDIVWGDEVLDIYPDIADACDEVVTGADGSMYAKIDATFHRRTNAGDVIVYVEENDGDRNPVRFSPPAGSTVEVEGVETAWRNLADRQRIRFYIPSDRFALLSDVEEAPMVAVVHEEVVVAEPEPEPMPEPEPEPIAMPTTAANTGAWLLSGLLLMLGGGALLARQR